MKPIDAKTREAVLKRAAANVPTRDIVRDLRLSKSTVCRILKNSR